jgi:GH15 family glucan-1,4-alpha-glucosidase
VTDPGLGIAPPHVLREYALIADGQRGALIGPRGDISWLCAPRWDSGSVFSALIGGAGAYNVTPQDPYVWGGYYEEASLVWHSRWVTHAGIVECVEALAYPGDPDRVVLLRRVRPVDAPARLDVMLRPRADYDRKAVTDWSREGDVWTGRAGPLRLRWSGARGARPRHSDALGLHIELEPGEEHDLVLEISDGALPDELPDAHALWEATRSAWERAVPALDNVLAPRDTRHGYAVLRGLTGAAGTVAAATTSLPERSGEGRSYDYRYVWIRDQCYIGQGIAACGALPLLEESVHAVADRLIEYGDRLAPAYTVSGEPVPEQRRLKLPGYPGGTDIVGNQVRSQFQLDAFGEAMLLFAAAARHDCLDATSWRAAEIAAGAVAERWKDLDAGIWEIDDRAWTHSRLICAAGLRGLAGVTSSERAADWLTLADRIVADTAQTSLHPDGRWQRSPDDPAPDASLLFAGVRGAVPADDPRTTATLDGYLRELTVDGYAYRFRHDGRDLAQAEGSFLLCGFVTALALAQVGRDCAAVGWYERTRSACGPPQLFSEEYDSQQHQMRGNLPQAFVHALMIETSARLAGKE